MAKKIFKDFGDYICDAFSKMPKELRLLSIFWTFCLYGSLANRIVNTATTIAYIGAVGLLAFQSLAMLYAYKQRRNNAI